MQLTNEPHPTPQLRDLQREILQYSRADGVALNAELFLPPGYDKDTHGPLPCLLWAYPRCAAPPPFLCGCCFDLLPLDASGVLARLGREVEQVSWTLPPDRTWQSETWPWRLPLSSEPIRLASGFRASNLLTSELSILA